MKKITLNVMKLISHGRNHAERAVPEYQEYLIIIILSSLNFFLCQFPWLPIFPLAL